jgi:hypothetical protein
MVSHMDKAKDPIKTISEINTIQMKDAILHISQTHSTLLPANMNLPKSIFQMRIS